MKTKAVRLYGENDLRLEEFELPRLEDGQILIKVVSDSVCMSTYKTVKQGAKHLRVPEDVAEHPVIIGHEFCGEIIEVTDKWKDKYRVGEKVVMPPVLSYLGGMQTVGYSFGEIGGVSTYSVVYEHIIENGYLMKLESDCFFKGSLIEPASCVIRGYKGSLHLDAEGKPYANLKPGGKVAIDGRIPPKQVPLEGRGGETGLLLTSAKIGQGQKEDRIYGSHFLWGSTGLASLGNGTFYISHHGAVKEGGCIIPI